MANKHLRKLWILTLLISPFVYAVFILVIKEKGQVVSLLELLLVTFIFSIMFSLPPFLIASLVNKITSKLRISDLNRKLINISIAGIGLICTLLYISGSTMPVLIGAYIISLIMAAILLELFFRTKVQKRSYLQ